MKTLFAKNLKVAMIEQEVSREELAEETDISPSSISKYCTGERTPGWKHLMKIKNALNLKLDEMT
jgi:transcriptional regulator with XRE-family HTH domain